MATKYSNGYVPSYELIQLDSGNGRHWSTRRSAARWYQLRANVQKKYGKTLHITAGFNTPRDENAYRSYSAQAFARAQACREGNCNAAAAAGYSSHGGTWRSAKYTGGQWVDAMAFDIGDYWQIGKDAFYAEAEAVGFRAGLITPELAGIFEPWHIIDFDPYGALPAGGGAQPFPTTLKESPDMNVVKWGAHILTFAPQQVKHETVEANAIFIAKLTSAEDTIYTIQNDTELMSICESFGVPLGAVHGVIAGTAYNVSGERYSGGAANYRFWSQTLESKWQFWGFPVAHPLTGQIIPVIEYIKAEPAEHKLTRDAIVKTPEGVWAHKLQHSNDPKLYVGAGEFLRAEPREHAITREAIAKISTPTVDVDEDAIADAIIAQMPTGVNVDYDRIASDVRAKFKTEPLT